MKKMLMTTVGLSLLVFSTATRADDSYTATCEELGYKTNLADCTVGLPLLCPISGNEAKSALKCLCMTESCRGYSLVEGDLDALASDGRKVREHIKELETCDSGVGADKVTYYRIKECQEGSLYQVQKDKPTCDVGCPRSRYPYSEHPGDLAGEVESCVDGKGTWFGFTKCNDGWVASGEDGHECKFNDCTITDYPYMEDPNLLQYRGQVKVCKSGNNTYYKYTDVDSEGNKLTEDSCDLNGYTLRQGVCIANCEIDIKHCESTLNKSAFKADKDDKDDTRGYYDWRCGSREKYKNCRVGDRAIIGTQSIGTQSIGTIIHLPDANDDRVLVVGGSLGSQKWANGVTETTQLGFPYVDEQGETKIERVNITNSEFAIKDMDGKKRTYQIMKFKETDSEYGYPAAEACYDYTVDNCTHDMCKAGQWYLPSEGELGYMYDNRYILYNATGDERFYQTWWWSSTEYNYDTAWNVSFRSSGRDGGGKCYAGTVRPVLAF